MINRILNLVNIKIINPLQSLPVQWYYSLKKDYSLLNENNCNHHIVVSLTSFPPRFRTLHLAIKSILNQKMKPDVILLCLAKEEAKNEFDLPDSIIDLKKYGLQILYIEENLKPHKKYLYAMKNYPNSIIITVDDDIMYDKNLIKDLYDSYLKYPYAVSARRVHKIIKDKNNNILPYTDWLYEYKKEKKPSLDLIATGVGGILYPPCLLPPETFDTEKIKKLCLNADDIWLKFMELKNNIPVVCAKGRRIHPYTITNTQKITLQKNIRNKKLNDIYLTLLQDFYNIDIASFINNN
jgi:hypothetical protein